MAAAVEPHTFTLQQITLVCIVWGASALMVHHPVAGVVPVILGHTQYFSYQSCVFVSADKLCNLAVGGGSSLRNLTDN